MEKSCGGVRSDSEKVGFLQVALFLDTNLILVTGNTASEPLLLRLHRLKSDESLYLSGTKWKRMRVSIIVFFFFFFFCGRVQSLIEIHLSVLLPA